MNASPEIAAASSLAEPGKPYFSRRGFRNGVIAVSPVIVSLFATGLVFGTLAAQKGLTLLDALAMSGFVYGGLVQVVSLQSWPQEFTLATLLTLMLVTLAVNLRLFLMSITFRPWFGALPAWQAYPILFFITDIGWLRAMRYRAEGGSDVGFFLGGGLFLHAVWLLSTAAGVEFSNLLRNPRALGIDLLLPIFFATLLIPAWRGPRRAVPWLIAGIVAVTVQWLAAGYWYIIAGAVSGAIAAGVIGDD